MFPGQSDEAKIKCKKTCEEKYSGPSPMCSEEVRAKSRETCRRKYGVESVSCDPEIREKQKASYAATCESDYGGMRPSETEAVRESIAGTVSSPECRAKTAATCRERLGVDYPMQCPEIRRKAQARYSYDGKTFDSAPEIAFYVWLTDREIPFEFQPDCEFWYEYEENGRVFRRRYFPDFKIDSEFFEIKGGHMISESGEWICPWDRSKDARYAAKGRCAAANGIHVVLPSEYAKYVEYVEKKYGKKWLSSFRNRKTESK